MMRVVVIGEEAVYGRGSTLPCVGRWDVGVRNAVCGKEGKLVWGMLASGAKRR